MSWRCQIQEQHFAELRQREFARLDLTGSVYLDHTGSALYPESLVTRHAEFLRKTVLGNPHSENPAAHVSTQWVDDARGAVLRFLDASPAEYAVIFTANASAALKLVGEAFPFTRGSHFVLAQDNHNSVNGIRELAGRRGASVKYLPLDNELRLREPAAHLPRVGAVAPSLLAFPAQSNFSGVKHPLELVTLAQNLGYTVLLDAAAFAPANAMSLQRVQPDFLALSFYKMFGFPTGVGALVARRNALARLQRPWFAGGTVEFVSTLQPSHQLLPGEQAFEDGTGNFLSIAAVPAGLALLERVGMERLCAHVTRLTARLLDGLRTLHWRPGRAGVHVYGPDSLDQRGGTVSFNVLNPAGRVIACDDFVQAAGRNGISLRAGCFCNPGAAEAAFGYTAARVGDCLQSMRDSFSHERFSVCMGGAPVGAVRASLGLSSSAGDVDALLRTTSAFLRPDPASYRAAFANVWATRLAESPDPTHHAAGWS